MSTSAATPTPTSFLPPGENAADLWIERSNYNAVTIGAFLYGIHFTLFLIAMYYFFYGKRLNRVEWGMVTYVFLLFASASVYTGTDSKWGEMMFIDDRNFPGGPLGFYVFDYNVPMIIAGNCAYIVTNFLADGLVLYRTWIVWNRNWLVVAFPLLVYAGSTAMSIIAVFQLAQPGSQFFSKVGLSFALPYFSLSIALNLLLTLMICGKLLLTRARLRSILGEAHARLYTGLVAMLVESAALYSLFSIMFIATYSINNSWFNVCLPSQAQIMCISPLLIIIRVARGRGFSHEAISRASTNMFTNSTNSKTRVPGMHTSRTNASGTEMWAHKEMVITTDRDSAGSKNGHAYV